MIISLASKMAKPSKRAAAEVSPIQPPTLPIIRSLIGGKVPNPPLIIAKGVAPTFTVANEERYTDPYVVPTAEAVPLAGQHVHKDGSTEECKLGYCWTVGKGRYFYLQLGHETNPIYFQPEIRKVMANAVLWAAKK